MLRIGKPKDIPWAKEIATAVDAREAALQLAKNAGFSLSSSSIPVSEARYKSINFAIEETGLTNVMEAACGLSPRGLELAAKNIRDVLLKRGGAWITTDLAFHEIMFEAMDSGAFEGALTQLGCRGIKYHEIQIFLGSKSLVKSFKRWLLRL